MPDATHVKYLHINGLFFICKTQKAIFVVFLGIIPIFFSGYADYCRIDYNLST